MTCEVVTGLQILKDSDDLQEGHELDCHGLTVDWKPDPFVSLGYVLLQDPIDTALTLTGAIPPYIYRDIGGVDRWVWFVSTFGAFPLISLTYV